MDSTSYKLSKTLSQIIPLADNKGVKLENDKIIAVYRRGTAWKEYSNQESDISVELVNKYYESVQDKINNGPKSLNDRLEDIQEDLEDLVEEIEEIQAQKIVEEPKLVFKDIQSQVSAHYQDIVKEEVKEYVPLSLQQFLKTGILTHSTRVSFLRRKYGNATYTLAQWREVLAKENLIDV